MINQEQMDNNWKELMSIIDKHFEGEQKVKEDIEATHQLFKSHVSQYRELDLDDVATGETWPALLAHEKGLVDKIYTSDEYINDHMDTHAILIVSTKENKSLLRLLKNKAMSVIHSLG